MLHVYPVMPYVISWHVIIWSDITKHDEAARHNLTWKVAWQDMAWYIRRYLKCILDTCPSLHCVRSTIVSKGGSYPNWSKCTCISCWLTEYYMLIQLDKKPIPSARCIFKYEYTQTPSRFENGKKTNIEQYYYIGFGGVWYMKFSKKMREQNISVTHGESVVLIQQNGWKMFT